VAGVRDALDASIDRGIRAGDRAITVGFAVALSAAFLLIRAGRALRGA